MQVLRNDHLRQVRLLLREFPVVALLGPRQVGKTTLARQEVRRGDKLSSPGAGRGQTLRTAPCALRQGTEASEPSEAA